MSNLNLDIRKIKAVIIGILIIVFGKLILQLPGWYLTFNFIQTSSPSQLYNYFQNHITPPLFGNIVVNFWYYLAYTLTLMLPILAGFVVGKIVKQKPWLYAGTSGFIVAFFSVVLILFSFLWSLPKIQSVSNSQIYQKYLFQQGYRFIYSLINGVILIFSTALGGWISVKVSKQKK